ASAPRIFIMGLRLRVSGIYISIPRRAWRVSGYAIGMAVGAPVLTLLAGANGRFHPPAGAC
ncbi:MAG: hypothetical protein PBV86_25070, partial [Delftia lacustris]|uniref:hypothetical protein n=1 Tax=Delftia lacustris TaxID=558537 RepID=UPI002F413F10